MACQPRPAESVVEALQDFLTFDTLISPQALVVFYYLGAVGMPVAAWIIALYLMRRFALAREALRSGKEVWDSAVPLRYRLLAAGIFVAAFLFMELMWRMMFEYLIAFMQIRDALVGP